MRVEFVPSPALYPFQSRWFETDGIRVHYIDEGAAESGLAGAACLACQNDAREATQSALVRIVSARKASGAHERGGAGSTGLESVHLLGLFHATSA